MSGEPVHRGATGSLSKVGEGARGARPTQDRLNGRNRHADQKAEQEAHEHGGDDAARASHLVDELEQEI
jgi:hypothetical protein